MCMTSRPRQRGFTMVELIFFIVVVAVALVGILAVMNSTVKSSADPMVRKQALALAESTLEEVLQKAYTDPDGTNAGETDRSNWDDVSDYNGKTQANLGLPASVASYAVAIAVVADNVTLGVPAFKVTVTVTRGVESITLIGYRTNY